MPIQEQVAQILIAFLVMTIPMSVISSVLLGLIFHLRVTQNDFVSNHLAFTSNQIDNNAYFVNISATTFITLASWSSTLAPILIGFAVTLASYPIAKGLLKDSQRKSRNLPTPFQLSLILQMIANSGLGSLWSWIVYTIGWRGRRESQGRALKALTRTLMLGILLAALILATDTWLHLATKTVIFHQIERWNATDVSRLSFGIRIPGIAGNDAGCTNTDTDTTLTDCNIYILNGGKQLILDRGPLQILANISDTAIVKTYTQDGRTFAYLASPSSPQLASLDYTARSFAIQSSCTPITSQCTPGNPVSFASITFKCPFAFNGFLSTGPRNDFNMSYFTNSTGADDDTKRISNMSNPYYYAAMTLSDVANVKDDVSGNSTEVLSTQSGQGAFIGLFCNATVYNLEYSSVNGTITQFEIEKTNSSTTRIVQASQRYSKLGDPYLLQKIGVAGLNPSLRDFTQQFELAYSQTALAIAYSAFEARPAVEFQTRRQILVARVPKAPLYCLVAANLLLVALGIVLTAIALVTVRGDTKELQARLTITAIVAALLQDSQARAPVRGLYDMFEEKQGHSGPRIGLARTQEGGWAYMSWAVE